MTTNKWVAAALFIVGVVFMVLHEGETSPWDFATHALFFGLAWASYSWETFSAFLGTIKGLLPWTQKKSEE